MANSQIYNSNDNDNILDGSSLKKKKTIKIPTVEELFDVANNEGENEAIIDDELLMMNYILMMKLCFNQK